jgi:hypothetical protein
MLQDYASLMGADEGIGTATTYFGAANISVLDGSQSSGYRTGGYQRRCASARSLHEASEPSRLRKLKAPGLQLESRALPFTAHFPAYVRVSAEGMAPACQMAVWRGLRGTGSYLLDTIPLADTSRPAAPPIGQHRKYLFGAGFFLHGRIC